MKNFQSYNAEKYTESKYKEVEEGIYQTKDPYNISKEDIYVTSVTFEFDPEKYEEEESSPKDMPQIPIEAILDEFDLFVTDFYDDLNKDSEKTCYQEFGSLHIEGVRRLRGIIGKQAYVMPYNEEEDEDEEYSELVIEWIKTFTSFNAL